MIVMMRLLYYRKDGRPLWFYHLLFGGARLGLGNRYCDDSFDDVW